MGLLGIGIGLIGVAFWAFMASVVIAEENGKTKRRRADLELIRFAIEKGQPLSPELVEKILTRKNHLLRAGVVTMASGLGVMVFALFLSRVATAGGWVVAGAGATTVCVGLGLIASHYFSQRGDEPTVLSS